MRFKVGQKLRCNKNHWAYEKCYAIVTRVPLPEDYGVWIQLYDIADDAVNNSGCDCKQHFDPWNPPNVEEENVL